MPLTPLSLLHPDTDIPDRYGYTLQSVTHSASTPRQPPTLVPSLTVTPTAPLLSAYPAPQAQHLCTPSPFFTPSDYNPNPLSLPSPIISRPLLPQHFLPAPSLLSTYISSSKTYARPPCPQLFSTFHEPTLSCPPEGFYHFLVINPTTLIAHPIQLHCSHYLSHPPYLGWLGLWGFLWCAPSAKRKDDHRVSSWWSSTWSPSSTGLSSTQYEQMISQLYLGFGWLSSFFGQ